MAKRLRESTRNENTKILKVSGRELYMPPLKIGVGMACPKVGIPRYMQIAKQRFDNLGIVSVFLHYNKGTKQYGIYKNIEAILRASNSSATGSRITPTPQPHFIMAGVRDGNIGHAVSILVDPSSRKMWIFDPFGNQVFLNPLSLTLQTEVLPIIRRMWKIPEKNMIFYRGPNLQAMNTRGTCTTYYLTFMDIIPYLLTGQANLKNIPQIADTALRQFYLNFAPDPPGRAIVKNVRARG